MWPSNVRCATNAAVQQFSPSSKGESAQRLLGGNSTSPTSWGSFTQKGSKLIGRMKATAHSAATAAAGVAIQARASSQKPTRSAGGFEVAFGIPPPSPRRGAARRPRGRPTPMERDEKLQAMSTMGFGTEAAALALYKNDEDLNAACLWLLDDGSREEILAAEAAQMVVSAEVECDDARGLGMGRSRISSSEESTSSSGGSPANVATSSRRSSDSQETSEVPASSIEGSHDDGPDGSDSDDEPRLADDELLALEAQVRKEAHVSPLPPVSACWDWPLSREEKKARVLMADKRMQLLDRQLLMEALVNERIAMRGGGRE